MPHSLVRLCSVYAKCRVKCVFTNANSYHLHRGTTNSSCTSIPGSVILTMTNPIWVVKTRLCLKDTDAVPQHMRYKGLTDGLINLYRYEGLRGCYKGYFPGLLGVSHGALQFMFYEELKKAYCNHYNIQLTTKLVSNCVIFRIKPYS